MENESCCLISLDLEKPIRAMQIILCVKWPQTLRSSQLRLWTHRLFARTCVCVSTRATEPTCNQTQRGSSITPAEMNSFFCVVIEHKNVIVYFCSPFHIPLISIFFFARQRRSRSLIWRLQSQSLKIIKLTINLYCIV